MSPGPSAFYEVRLGLSAALWGVSGAECCSMSCVWNLAPFYGMHLGSPPLHGKRLGPNTVLWCVSGAKHHSVARARSLVPFRGVRLVPIALLWCESVAKCRFMVCVWG